MGEKSGEEQYLRNPAPGLLALNLVPFKDILG